jgi:hypothetical protein
MDPHYYYLSNVATTFHIFDGLPAGCDWHLVPRCRIPATAQ